MHLTLSIFHAIGMKLVCFISILSSSNKDDGFCLLPRRNSSKMVSFPKKVATSKSLESRNAPLKRWSRKLVCGDSFILATRMKKESWRGIALKRQPSRSRSPRSPSTTTWCSWGLPRSSALTLISITMIKSAWFVLLFARRSRRRRSAPRPKVSLMTPNQAVVRPNPTSQLPRRPAKRHPQRPRSLQSSTLPSVKGQLESRPGPAPRLHHDQCASVASWQMTSNLKILLGLRRVRLL